jgi:hypothetical protein
VRRIRAKLTIEHMERPENRERIRGGSQWEKRKDGGLRAPGTIKDQILGLVSRRFIIL